MSSERLSTSDRQSVSSMISGHYQKKEQAVRAAFPMLDERIAAKATEEARKRLGISDLLKKRSLLKRQLEEVESAIEKKLPRKKRERYASCGGRMSECDAVGALAEQITPKLRSSDPGGRQLDAIEKSHAAAIMALAGCVDRTDIKVLLESLK